MAKKGTSTSKVGGGRSSAGSALSGGGKTTRVQVQNPVTGRFVKLDTRTGRIVDTKKTPGPYQHVPIKK